MNKDLITNIGIYKYSHTNRHGIDMFIVPNGHMSKELIEQMDSIKSQPLTINQLKIALNDSEKSIQKPKKKKKVQKRK